MLKRSHLLVGVGVIALGLATPAYAEEQKPSPIPRLIFLSDHERPYHWEIYLYDHQKRGNLTKLNSPVPVGCPGWPWYKRVLDALISQANASSTDPRAGCYRGTGQFWLTPDGQFLIYQAQVESYESAGLYLGRIDNPGHSVVLASSQFQRSPYVAAISPDSKSIILSKFEDDSGRPKFLLVDLLNPGVQHELTPTEDDQVLGRPKFSPDGGLFAFLQTKAEGGAMSIVVRHVANLGKSPLIVADDMSTIGDYAFTRGGSYIVYQSSTNRGRPDHLSLVSTTNPEIRTRWKDDLKSIGGIALSPNHRMLVYNTYSADKELVPSFVDLAEYGVKYYSGSDSEALFGAVQDEIPQFSRDSLKYVGRIDNASRYQVWRYSPETEEYIIMSTSPEQDRRIRIGFPIFLPDSSGLIYIKGRDLYMTRMGELEDPKKLSALSSDEARVSLFWLSADGRYVAYVANDPYTSRNVFVVELSAQGKPIQITNSSWSGYGVPVNGVRFLPPD